MTSFTTLRIVKKCVPLKSGLLSKVFNKAYNNNVVDRPQIDQNVTLSLKCIQLKSEV